MAITWLGTQTATGSSSSLAINRPTVVANDVLIAQVSTTGATVATPSGWTLIRDDQEAGIGYRSALFRRVAGASEPSSYTFSFGASGNSAGAITAYRGVDVSSPVTTHAATTYSSSTTTFTAPSVTTTADESLIVRAFTSFNTPWTTPTGHTERYDFGTVNKPCLALSDVAQQAAGATGTAQSSTAPASGTGVAQTLALARGNLPPNAPILTAPADGAGIDRNSVNRFDWDFSDPDAGDSQSKFDLRYRVIGAPSWTDVTGTTPNTYWDAPAGTFAAGDYEWQVRTYDAQGVVGPYSASSFFTAGDAPPAPTITAPINGATFSQTETVVWSAPDQDAYQLRILDAADAVVSDTGEVASTTARSRTVEFPVNNVARKIQVRVKDGGLWSPYYTISGNVSWTPPATPVVSLLSDDESGALVVTVTNPAPTGDEPPVNYNDIYVNDGGGEIRVATMVTPNTSWTYWLPKSGRDYAGNVRAVAVADNGITASSS